MKPSISLPQSLQKKYDEITEEFNAVADDWKKYNDELIPEDTSLARKIIDFLIAVAEHIETNYAKIDVNAWGQFLRDYYYAFYYGPMGDDNNYLDFDEISIADILLTIPVDKKLSKQQVTSLKKKLMATLKEFK